MRREVRVRDAAQQELVDAVAWYEARTAGAGLRLLDDLAAVVDRLRAGETGSPHPSVDGARSILASRFPYAVVFFVDHDVVEIVAFAHGARHPAYWRGRAP